MSPQQVRGQPVSPGAAAHSSLYSGQPVSVRGSLTSALIPSGPHSPLISHTLQALPWGADGTAAAALAQTQGFQELSQGRTEAPSASPASPGSGGISRSSLAWALGKQLAHGRESIGPWAWSWRRCLVETEIGEAPRSWDLRSPPHPTPVAAPIVLALPHHLLPWHMAKPPGGSVLTL